MKPIEMKPAGYIKIIQKEKGTAQIVLNGRNKRIGYSIWDKEGKLIARQGIQAKYPNDHEQLLTYL